MVSAGCHFYPLQRKVSDMLCTACESNHFNRFSPPRNALFAPFACRMESYGKGHGGKDGRMDRGILILDDRAESGFSHQISINGLPMLFFPLHITGMGKP